LIEKIRRASQSILHELLSEPGYIDLSPRAQARLFSGKVGEGILATLLQLARVNKLNVNIAHTIIKRPDEFKTPPLSDLS